MKVYLDKKGLIFEREPTGSHYSNQYTVMKNNHF